MPGLDSLMLHGHSQLPRKFPVSVLISLKSSYLTLSTIIPNLLLFPNQLCADSKSIGRRRFMLSFQGSLERYARGFGRASRDSAHSHKAGLKIDSCRSNGMGEGKVRPSKGHAGQPGCHDSLHPHRLLCAEYPSLVGWRILV